MEFRAFTIAFSKKKAKRKRDEESILLSEMMRLQTKLQTSYRDFLIPNWRVVERVGTSMVGGIVGISIS